MEYEIRLGREIRNGSLHIGAGAVIAHTLIPYLDWYWIVTILLMLGAAREYWQYRRGKIQPMYIHIIDTLTFGLGGLSWYYVKKRLNVNVDEL